MSWSMSASNSATSSTLNTRQCALQMLSDSNNLCNLTNDIQHFNCHLQVQVSMGDGFPSVDIALQQDDGRNVAVQVAPCSDLCFWLLGSAAMPF